MPPIHQLNYPPHPFWDFVQEMNEHPFWRGPQPAPQDPENKQTPAPEATAGQSTEKGQRAPADDPPEVDPSTLRGEECKHSRRCARRCGRDRGREGRRGGWPGFGHSPFMMGGDEHAGLHGPHGPIPPPPPFGFHGRRWHHPHRGGPHFRGGPHRGGPRGHPHGPPPPPPPPPPHPAGPGFNLGRFLNDLGGRIGIDLNNAAEGLGIDRFMPNSTNPDVDFEPKVDIFDLDEQFVIHASLPGARKEDVGVDWDGEHSVLRVAGVVHRPEADEKLLQRLVVDGRKREVGVFEKVIRLGTDREPASIDVSGIKAKMTDGVLVIRVPKVEKEHHKRDVPISSATPSPPQYDDQYLYEDQDMYDVPQGSFQSYYPSLQPEQTAAPVSRTASAEPTPKAIHVQPQPQQPTTSQSEKKSEPEQNQEQQQSSEEKGKSKQVEFEQEQKSHATTEEPLPTYHSPSHPHDGDWDEFGSEEEEGEYVKINVD